MTASDPNGAAPPGGACGEPRAGWALAGGSSRPRPELAPPWLRELIDGVRHAGAERLTLHRVPAPPNARRAAVLIAFGEHPVHGPDVLLVERASTLRNHAGQVAFPGGGTDPGDADEIATALREAREETALDPAGVVPLALLPSLHLPPSGFLVTPVLAHWARPVAVHAVDPDETAAVVRVPVTDLADPANRVRVRHSSGMVGNAFVVTGLLVWGFTGVLLSALLDLGGWAQPWDETQVVDLDMAWSAARSNRREVSEP